MKSIKFLRLMPVVLLLTISAGCKAQKNTDRVTVTGVETVSLPAFDTIENGSAVNLYITQGNKRSVRVKYASNWRLKMSVSGSTLKIENEEQSRQINNKKSAEVWITMPSLKAISNGGALQVITGDIKGDELSISNSGAMTMRTGKLDIKALTCDNCGALTDTITAECERISIENSGRLKTRLTAKSTDDFSLENQGHITTDLSVTGKTVRIENDGAMNGDMAMQAGMLTFSNCGAGTLKINFTGGDVNIDNNGNATVDLQVDCKALKAETSGISKLTISGTADDCRFNSSGISKIDSSKLNKF